MTWMAIFTNRVVSTFMLVSRSVPFLVSIPGNDPQIDYVRADSAPNQLSSLGSKS